jgi:hypothetical protein
MRPGMMRGTSFDSDGDDDDGNVVPKPVSTMRPGMTRGRSFDKNGDDVASKPVSSMRPGMTRGKSFDFDADDYGGDAVSKPRSSMRPDMTRGTSFDSGSDSDSDAPGKSQKLKNAEEEKAKMDLVELLNQDSEQEKGATDQLKSYSSLRDGYISSIDVLRPEAKPFLVQTKDDRKKEAGKVRTYENLKNAWETYEDTAQDKPDHKDITPEEKAAEGNLIAVEAAVDGEWHDYAKEAVKAIQNGDGSDDESDDDSERDSEWAFWILEAKKLKSDAERKKAKEEKKRMRKEKKAQKKRLEADDRNTQIAKVREKREAKDCFHSDSDSDDATVTKGKNGGKTGKRNPKSDVDGSDVQSESGVEEERERSKVDSRQKREAVKTKVKSVEDVKEVLLGTSKDDRRRQVVFSLYSKMSTPTRSEFKERVAALHSFSYNPDDVSPDDVDLLPWNESATFVDIAKMNSLVRAGLTLPKQ